MSASRWDLQSLQPVLFQKQQKDFFETLRQQEVRVGTLLDVTTTDDDGKLLHLKIEAS